MPLDASIRATFVIFIRSLFIVLYDREHLCARFVNERYVVVVVIRQLFSFVGLFRQVFAI